MTPRLPPLAPADWPPEMADAIKALRPVNPRHPLPSRDPGRPKGLNALGTLARHPALTTALHTFNGHILFGSTLSPRERELIVLRVAMVRDSEYEWAQHSILAADAGISEEEIERVRSGPASAGWSETDAAILRAVDELVVDALISEPTWDTLAAEFDEQQLMDLVFTVGAYDMLAMAFRSFGVELDADLRK